MLEKGLVQIYTGDGKGKTTAAFGLALRAVGQGNSVLVYQFLKPSNLDLGERFTFQKVEGIKIETLDIQWDMFKSFDDPQILAKTQAAIASELENLGRAAEKKLYDLIILDEIVYCVSRGLARLEDVKKLIKRKKEQVEIVLTGVGATEELIALADLVTEMKNIKHPFDKGIKARRGIEY